MLWMVSLGNRYELVVMKTKLHAVAVHSIYKDSDKYVINKYNLSSIEQSAETTHG
jgi:hypothetical protein